MFYLSGAMHGKVDQNCSDVLQNNPHEERDLNLASMQPKVLPRNIVAGSFISHGAHTTTNAQQQQFFTMKKHIVSKPQGKPGSSYSSNGGSVRRGSTQNNSLDQKITKNSQQRAK